MSILAAAAAANESFAGAAEAALCLAVGLPLTARLLRRGHFAPADRLPPVGSAWPLVLALAWGLLLWLVVPAAYLSSRGLVPRGTTGATAPASMPADTQPAATQHLPPLAPSPAGRTLDLARLPPSDVAFLAAVPHLAVLLALCAADVFVYGGDLRPLGFSPHQAPAGLLAGLLFSIAFVPLVFGGAILTDWFYQWVRYEHPREHDLLRVLGQSAQPWVRLAIVAGATVIAPVSEELLFRGHAQTILRRAMARLAAPLPTPADAAPVQPAPTPAWATWMAIVLTSALFASVHERWTWPPIFLLSLCLGWAYERTGKLWASVAVHATFNTVSTLIFLAGPT